MQRPIKFRAWDYTSNVMRNDITEMVFNSDGTLNQINVETGADILFPEKECVLMQYTGLKDKNGVNIYEGDIILVIDAVSMEQSIHDVKWVGIGWTRQILFTQVEVIGNIYENPELLETRE